MNRTLWRGGFDPVSPPKYPCPECGKGQLAKLDGAHHLVEPAYSKNEHNHDAWDPDWIRERFSLMLQCSDKACGETVVFSGNTSLVETYEEGPDGYEQSYTTVYHPKSAFPAPPIIAIPKNAPEEVIKPLMASFALYWVDAGAGAARVRASLERG